MADLGCIMKARQKFACGLEAEALSSAKIVGKGSLQGSKQVGPSSRLVLANIHEMSFKMPFRCHVLKLSGRGIKSCLELSPCRYPHVKGPPSLSEDGCPGSQCGQGWGSGMASTLKCSSICLGWK